MSQIKINISVDLEDCPLNVDSLIGTIEISDGLRAIVDNATFLDSWLNALIQGIGEIQIRPHCEIDLIDEPDPLILDVKDGKLVITYKDMTVIADSPESFAADLKDAISAFLEIVQRESGNESTELLEEIGRFVKSQS